MSNLILRGKYVGVIQNHVTFFQTEHYDAWYYWFDSQSSSQLPPVFRQSSNEEEKIDRMGTTAKKIESNEKGNGKSC